MTKAVQKSIKVRYFALLREQRGLDEEAIQSTARTPRELYAMLRERHGLDLRDGVLKVAINDEFRDWDTSLKDGDTVVFIQPVAGG